MVRQPKRPAVCSRELEVGCRIPGGELDPVLLILGDRLQRQRLAGSIDLEFKRGIPEPDVTFANAVGLVGPPIVDGEPFVTVGVDEQERFRRVVCAAFADQRKSDLPPFDMNYTLADRRIIDE